MKELKGAALAAGVLTALILAGEGPARAQAGLPDTVTEPYRRYVQAQDAGDVDAALAAALEAWDNAAAADVDPGVRKALGTNAVDAARNAEDWPAVIRLAEPVAALHDGEDELDTAVAILELGLEAAFARLDRVHYDPMLATGLDLLASHDAVGRGRLVRLMRPSPPNSHRLLAAVDVDALSARASARQEEGADAAIAYVNAQAARRAVLTLNGDFEDAFAILEATIDQLQDWGLDQPQLFNAVFADVSGLLVNSGLAPDGSGADVFSEEARVAWCAYLARRPAVLAEHNLVEYPARAVERGYEEAVVVTGLRIPATGGPAEVLSLGAFGDGTSIYANAVRDRIRADRFRPQCNPAAGALEVRRIDGFAVVDGSPGRSRVVTGHTFAVFTLLE
ncbi:MAG: hypothetical protein U9P68_04580 [Pseudomonadota bacterium]|nr:hypothetical protein [Pseudomonadota bacterium]